MKTIILAGGFGTRLAEFTEVMPKPMVPVGGRPIIWHIMQHYARYGHRDFFLALGYKSAVIKQYFQNHRVLDSDFTINLSNYSINYHQSTGVDWDVTLVDTGLDSMTGGRVKRLQPYIGSETFMLTYGDGLSDIDLNELESFHLNHGKMVTVTAVHPGARFGELEIAGDKVTSFQEKPQVGRGWINGGYFVINPDFFDLIDNDKSILEREPLERAAQMGELIAFKHEAFWQCMDTKRDKDLLEELWESGKAPWKE